MIPAVSKFLTPPDPGPGAVASRPELEARHPHLFGAASRPKKRLPQRGNVLRLQLLPAAGPPASPNAPAPRTTAAAGHNNRAPAPPPIASSSRVKLPQPGPLTLLAIAPKPFRRAFYTAWNRFDDQMMGEALSVAGPTTKLIDRMDRKGKRPVVQLRPWDLDRMGRLAYLLTPSKDWRDELNLFLAGLNMVVSSRGRRGFDIVQDASLMLVQPDDSIARVRLLFSLGIADQPVLDAFRPIVAFALHHQLQGGALPQIFERLLRERQPQVLGHTVMEMLRAPGPQVTELAGSYVMEAWLGMTATVDINNYHRHWTEFICRAVLTTIAEELAKRSDRPTADEDDRMQRSLDNLVNAIHFNTTDKNRITQLFSQLPQQEVSTHTVDMTLELLNHHGPRHRDLVLTQTSSQTKRPATSRALILGLAVAGQNAYQRLFQPSRKSS